MKEPTILPPRRMRRLLQQGCKTDYIPLSLLDFAPVTKCSHGRPESRAYAKQSGTPFSVCLGPDMMFEIAISTLIGGLLLDFVDDPANVLLVAAVRW